jgi:molybdopterin synthase sulfur carrier subunit
MAKVNFTAHLRHVAPKGEVEAAGATLAAVLADVFARYPALRGYVLDDQDRLRLHIAVFVDGVHVRQNVMYHPLRAGSEVYIMQALSGG